MIGPDCILIDATETGDILVHLWWITAATCGFLAIDWWNIHDRIRNHLRCRRIRAIRALRVA